MPFSKIVAKLTKTIHKIKSESDRTRRVYIADEMSDQANELLDQAKGIGSHIAPFAKFAWRLDMLFLSCVVLLFYLMLLFLFVGDFLPPETYQNIDSIEPAGDENVFWYILLGLLTVPIAFDLIIAVVCKHTPAAEGKPADVKAKTRQKMSPLSDPWQDTRERLHRVEDTLDDVRKELDPVHPLPAGTGAVLSLLFTLCMGIMWVYILWEEFASGLLELFAGFLGGALLLGLSFGLFQLLLWLKQCVLALFFSNWKCRRQAGKLFAVFVKEIKKMDPLYITKKEKEDRAKNARAPVHGAKFRGSGSFGSYGSGYGSDWNRINDDLDALRHAGEITKTYGEDWIGYDAEAPIHDVEALGPDPESFPDSSDIW